MKKKKRTKDFFTVCWTWFFRLDIIISSSKTTGRVMFEDIYTKKKKKKKTSCALQTKEKVATWLAEEERLGDDDLSR